MNMRKWMSVLLLFTASCSSLFSTATPTPEATETPAPTATLPQPAVRVTRAPDPDAVARAYLDAWQADDFPAMYALLAGSSRAQIDEPAFTKRYLDALAPAAVASGAVNYEILRAAPSPAEAQVSYRVTLQSSLFGDITREAQMNLVLEGGTWAILWDDSLVLPDLAGGNSLRVINYIPERGWIYDRNGELLVGTGEAYSIGIVPSAIDPDQEESMLESLARATGFPPEYLYTFYVDYGLNSDVYIPITDVDADTPTAGPAGYDAVQVYSFSGRYYYDKTAPQTIGYTSAIQPEEVNTYMRNGYMWTERVPRDGVELWAEKYLGGVRGGMLYLDAPDGTNLSVLGQKNAQPSFNVYTTLDHDLQLAAQKALFGFNGAVVVLERDTGRVLAMASSPDFNPNLFEPSNYNALFTSPFNNPNAPLFNRASRGQYPLGSAFKIITLAAALESGRFSPTDTLECGHEFTELGNPVLYDWTYWDEVDPSGTLTLPEGLMRSCNPWFWHIGLDFYNAGLTTAISDMAKGFGLGSPTGIEEVVEEPGQVPEPSEKLEATNLAIGQGDLLVTPLQVARFVAAVGNGGTLYRPQVVEQILSDEGAVVYQFAPEANGTLPVSAENLTVIQDAMKQVVRNRRGTAYRIFGSFARDIAGKTSTSETGIFDPDAWFVAFTFEENPDKPDVAVVAIIEQVGEGADFAAPIVRRVLEVYYFGAPRSLFPWEVRLGVPEDLIPEEEEEPTPEPDSGGG